MTEPVTIDYRTYSDAELDEHRAAIAAVVADRATIANEAGLIALHEKQAQDNLAAADQARADAEAARERQGITPGEGG